MRYRALTATGDYTLGQQQNTFLSGNEAIGQAITTRLTLGLGTAWFDLLAGFPWDTRVLGTPASDANITQINTLITAKIKATPEVTDITSYTGTVDRAQRVFKFNAQVQTINSSLRITGGTTL